MTPREQLEAAFKVFKRHDEQKGGFGMRSTREVADYLGWPLAKTRRELWKLVELGHFTCYEPYCSNGANLWGMDGPAPRSEI